MDFIFTVCDQAAAEPCPIWLGHPVTAHWDIPDPAAEQGSEDVRRSAFQRTYRQLETRIKLFAASPMDPFDNAMLARRTVEIGRIRLGRDAVD